VIRSRSLAEPAAARAAPRPGIPAKCRISTTPLQEAHHGDRRAVGARLACCSAFLANRPGPQRPRPSQRSAIPSSSPGVSACPPGRTVPRDPLWPGQVSS
jgi:hypothetical protein